MTLWFFLCFETYSEKGEGWEGFCSNSESFKHKPIYIKNSINKESNVLDGFVIYTSVQTFCIEIQELISAFFSSKCIFGRESLANRSVSCIYDMKKCCATKKRAADIEEMVTDIEEMVTDIEEMLADTEEMETDTEEMVTDTEEMEVDTEEMVADNEEMVTDTEEMVADTEEMVTDTEEMEADN